MNNINYDKIINDLEIITDELEERRQYLYSELSKVDREICDLEHAAEFFNFNVVKGYKLYKMLHDCCLRRREFKNELQKLDIILNNTIDSDSVEYVKKKLQNIENKTYNPRILKELFED